MKAFPIGLAAILATIASASATSVLFDDFNDGVIASVKWGQKFPYQNSVLAEESGALRTQARGQLYTTQEFGSPITVSGSFKMLDHFEHFGITLRSDLSEYGSFHELTGLLVSFSNDGDQIAIQRFSADTHEILALESFGLATGQDYDFSITDTGTSVTLALDGIVRLTANTSFSTGGHLAFHSREFSETATLLNEVTIASVPDNSAPTALLLGIAGLGLLSVRKQYLRG
jgi:hypothetical protein